MVGILGLITRHPLHAVTPEARALQKVISRLYHNTNTNTPKPSSISSYGPLLLIRPLEKHGAEFKLHYYRPSNTTAWDEILRKDSPGYFDWNEMSDRDEPMAPFFGAAVCTEHVAGCCGAFSAGCLSIYTSIGGEKSSYGPFLTLFSFSNFGRGLHGMACFGKQILAPCFPKIDTQTHTTPAQRREDDVL